jgi:hypothetical protein
MKLQDARTQKPDDDIQRNREKEEPARPEGDGPDLHFVRLCPVPGYGFTNESLLRYYAIVHFSLNIKTCRRAVQCVIHPCTQVYRAD